MVGVTVMSTSRREQTRACHSHQVLGHNAKTDSASAAHAGRRSIFRLLPEKPDAYGQGMSQYDTPAKCHAPRERHHRQEAVPGDPCRHRSTYSPDTSSMSARTLFQPVPGVHRPRMAVSGPRITLSTEWRSTRVFRNYC